MHATLPSLRTASRIRHALWCLTGDATNRLYPLALDAWRSGGEANAAALSAIIRSVVSL